MADRPDHTPTLIQGLADEHRWYVVCVECSQELRNMVSCRYATPTWPPSPLVAEPEPVVDSELRDRIADQIAQHMYGHPGTCECGTWQVDKLWDIPWQRQWALHIAESIADFAVAPVLAAKDEQVSRLNAEAHRNGERATAEFGRGEELQGEIAEAHKLLIELGADCDWPHPPPSLPDRINLVKLDLDAARMNVEKLSGDLERERESRQSWQEKFAEQTFESDAIRDVLDGLILDIDCEQPDGTTPSAGMSLPDYIAAMRAELDALKTKGIGLIGAERHRQIAQEGWTPEHDARHSEGQLAKAAASYALASYGSHLAYELWPFDADSYKPTDDAVPALVKAGALIAAEIDRLQAGQPVTEATTEQVEPPKSCPECSVQPWRPHSEDCQLMLHQQWAAEDATEQDVPAEPPGGES